MSITPKQNEIFSSNFTRMHGQTLRTHAKFGWIVPLGGAIIEQNMKLPLTTLLKKNNRKCNGFNGYNWNCIGFNGNYNGVYWYVMDYIGGVLNPIGQMPKTHYKKEFCNSITGKS